MYRFLNGRSSHTNSNVFGIGQKLIFWKIEIYGIVFLTKNSSMLQLWNWYPWEVVIFDPIEWQAKKVFLDSETWQDLKKKLNTTTTRYVEIWGISYFWSDIRSFWEVKLPKWLDHLVYKSGQISKKENQHKILVEYTRLLKTGSTFHGEESVFNFLTLSNDKI